MAKELMDTELIARMEGGDLIALEAKYHVECLTIIRNRYRSLKRAQEEESSQYSDEKKIKARTLVELYTHVENKVDEGTFFFKFSELQQLYQQRLCSLGIERQMNRIDFREKLLGYFPEAQEQSDGRNKIMIFEQGMQHMLKKTMTCDYEGDALVLAKAAKIVRKDVFAHDGFQFDGKFPSGCQNESVPSTLKTLISMILKGADLKDQCSTETQANLTISQTIMFNITKASTMAATSRHSQREPPLPLYIGMNIHTVTRCKKILTQLHHLGLSVSYDRILKLESLLATAVCEDFMEKGVVVPAQMHHGLFTVAALDNLDYNPSSTTAKGSFHGTGISLFQFPTSCNIGERQNSIALPSHATKNYQLPDNFSIVPAVALKTVNVSVPELTNMHVQQEGEMDHAQLKEMKWMDQACQLLDKDEVHKEDAVAWSAYHAAQDTSKDSQTTLTQLLPLFEEKASTAAMIQHGMNVVSSATEFLNPGQIPVIAYDAPLYALAKFTQWNWPNTHGEDKMVSMFGGLHIEMAMWKTYGDFLSGSGWTHALTQAGVATSGTADSFLKSSHVGRTRHAHQVTALALAKLQEESFKVAEVHTESKETWRKNMIQKHPTFLYWDTILRMELLGLIFIRSHREGNFSLYVESLKSLVPWFFALNHHNYARWIPIHIRDMESLPSPILQEFEEQGHWVIHKTTNRFSSIPIDQAHEQNNATVKGSGGAIGLTENPSAFRKWMVSGPEQARLLTEFEKEFEKETESDWGYHHEEGLATQASFKDQTEHLVAAITDLGNPFLGDGEELIALDTRNIMDDAVVKTVKTVYDVGKEQYLKYKEDVIINRTSSIHDPIKKNVLSLFSSPRQKAKTKKAEKMSMLKNDVSLFSHLYIVMQHRDSDMHTFFRHENHPFPPSLSENGKLYTGQKHKLLDKLTANVTSEDPPQSVDVKLLDGAAVVHMLPTTKVATFDEYAEQIVVPHVLKQLDTAKRVDVVWDTYIPNSLKESTREKRGKGIRRKVEGKNKLPRNWADFLRDPANKAELFAFLSNKISTTDIPDGKEIVVTLGSDAIVCGSNRHLNKCDHEEADSRLIVHLQDAITNDCSTCVVRTVDTDVIVILIGKFTHFVSLDKDVNIWVAFGTGNHFTYHHINAIYGQLGCDKSLALPAFHSFTGSDTTSAFFGRGKKKAWDAFTHIAQHPFTAIDIHSRQFQLLERFTVILYDKSSTLEHVDEARHDLFVNDRPIESLPPTQDALLQHTKRAAYQAGIWCTSEKNEQHAPSPEGWGWTLDEDSHLWVPVWITLPVASKACSELVKCGCKGQSGCGGNCACKRANWKCTELCKCHCDR